MKLVMEMENHFLDKYKNEGWTILNISNPGSLGGITVKWTKETCKKESLKYKSRIEFRKNSSSAYMTCRKNGWDDDVCGHMVKS